MVLGEVQDGRGLELVTSEGTRHVFFAVVEESAQRVPPQDIVFVTLKAHALPNAADELASLLKPAGHAVFVTNGVPWWWPHGSNQAAAGPMRVDPKRRLWNQFGPTRALGCVVYSSNEVVAPGKVLHRGHDRWLIGEPSNEVTSRLIATVELIKEGGLNCEASTDLRHAIWTKLLRNTPFNSLAALTRLGADQFACEPSLVVLAQALTDEVVAVARSKGWKLPPTRAADVVDPGGKLGIPGSKPSMLQDVLAGKTMEVEAIVGQVQQFARDENVRTPALDMVYALLRGLDFGLTQQAKASH